MGGVVDSAAVVKDHALLKVWLGHVTDVDTVRSVVESEREAAEDLLGEIRYSRRGPRRSSWATPIWSSAAANDRSRARRGTPRAVRRLAGRATARTARMTRNPHAGEPFTDDDATIAAALEDVSVPALLCSLVHMTGDPSWIRGDIRPRSCRRRSTSSAGSPPTSRPTCAAAPCR